MSYRHVRFLSLNETPELQQPRWPILLPKRLLQTTIKNPRIDERWFLSGPIGKNKIESLMKFMAKKSWLTWRSKNHLTRASANHEMTDNNVPDSLQVYVTGHKYPRSLNNYRTLNNTHKHVISSILSANTSCKNQRTHPPFRPPPVMHLWDGKNVSDYCTAANAVSH